MNVVSSYRFPVKHLFKFYPNTTLLNMSQHIFLTRYFGLLFLMVMSPFLSISFRLPLVAATTFVPEVLKYSLLLGGALHHAFFNIHLPQIRFWGLYGRLCQNHCILFYLHSIFFSSVAGLQSIGFQLKCLSLTVLIIGKFDVSLSSVLLLSVPTVRCVSSGLMGDFTFLLGYWLCRFHLLSCRSVLQKFATMRRLYFPIISSQQPVVCNSQLYYLNYPVELCVPRIYAPQQMTPTIIVARV